MRIVENKEELEKEAKTTETKKEHNKEKELILNTVKKTCS